MRNYFIRYRPEAKINYLYLFQLYGIANYDKLSRTYNTITYNTKKELAEKLTATYEKNALSYTTLTRLLNNDDYKDYFTIGYNKITLNNNFGNHSDNNHTPFIVITDKTADFFIKQKDNKLARYYCYIKYYCSLSSKTGELQDFTAKQYLSAIGLSYTNHNNLSMISRYNTLLVNEGLIQIRKYRDKYGYERNIYSIPQ